MLQLVQHKNVQEKTNCREKKCIEESDTSVWVSADIYYELMPYRNLFSEVPQKRNVFSHLFHYCSFHLFSLQGNFCVVSCLNSRYWCMKQTNKIDELVYEKWFEIPFCWWIILTSKRLTKTRPFEHKIN